VAPAGAGLSRRPPPSEAQAPALPVGPFSTAPRQTLRLHANDVIANLYWGTNELRRLAGKAEAQDDVFTAAWATHRFVEELRRVTELVVGKTTRLDVTIASQEDLPDWNALPAEVRAALDQAFEQLPPIYAGEARRVE